MNVYRTILIGFTAVVILAGCDSNTSDPSTTEDSLAYSGGATTIFLSSSASFQQPAPNLFGERLVFHQEGDLAFEQNFVPAPAALNAGLGPIFNNLSCASCHTSDGRGKPPMPEEILSSTLIRLSIPGTNEHGGPNPVPGFGGQLQHRATFGVAPEADVIVSYTESIGTYGDGTTYSLRRPVYQLTNSYIPLPSNVMISPRVGPPVFGLGLLEAVPEETIVALADELDADGDGISGKPNYVYDAKYKQMMLGRFGWKANTATLYHQTAGAYNEDMGITSPLMPVESCHGQPQAAGQEDDDPEITDKVLDAAVFYVQSLAVPARRKIGDAVTKKGEKLFADAGCVKCHTPKLKTGLHPTVPEVSYQTIRPYTDLLLHDMGDGLADNRPDYRADGREWRTPPLWGIGLTKLVSGHTFFLHDGRARNLEEAILWHGGEAESAKEFFRRLPKADRDALIAFLNSL